MKLKAGATDVTTYFYLRSSTDWSPVTTATITNIDLQYTRTGAAASTKADATALATTASAHADNKAIEVDGTSSPGLYRVDWPDAAFATGARQVVLSVLYTGAFTEHLVVDLEADPAPRVIGPILVPFTWTRDFYVRGFPLFNSAGARVTSPTFSAATDVEVSTNGAAFIPYDSPTYHANVALDTNGCLCFTFTNGVQSGVLTMTYKVVAVTAAGEWEPLYVVFQTYGTSTSAHYRSDLDDIASGAELAANKSVVDAVKVTTDKLDTALEADGAPPWRFTANALEQGASTAVAGAVATTINIKDNAGAGLVDVDVWVCPSPADTPVIASGRTDSSGNCVLYLDVGTYIAHATKAGYNMDHATKTIVVT